jgi:hypothetical protein
MPINTETLMLLGKLILQSITGMKETSFENGKNVIEFRIFDTGRLFRR